MRLPTWRDWLFSAKAFAAAMLALYVGLAFSLPRPYWALTTVYVVANPLSGVTGAKAFDRLFGTVLGCAGAVVLVVAFVNAPELLMLAVSLWAGLLLYIALHDRTPRNYAFMLAGYTLPLVALPNVTTPDAVFDYALGRSEEIMVGVVAAAVVGATVFPMSVGPVLNQRISGWLDDAATWIQDVLRAKGEGPGTPLARQRLAADVAPLTALISQLGHDAGTRAVKRHAEALRARLLFLLPVLSSITDRLHAVRMEVDAFSPELEAVAGRIAAWVKAPPAAGRAGPQDSPAVIADGLRSALKALEPAATPALVWEDLLRASLVSRLRELVDLWQDCLALQRHIAEGGRGRWKPVLRHRPLIGRGLHYDRGLMLFAVLSTVSATFLAGLAWIWSGWSGGANAVAFVAISCCFFGALDRPAPMMRTMLVWTLTAYVATGVYLITVLPGINDFELLALALAPPFLLVGAFIPRPELALVTLLLAASFAGDLGLQGRYSFDFASYVEGGIAVTLGLAFALAWTTVVKPFGAEITVRRLVRAGWADLAGLAARQRAVDHATLIGRTLDRLAQLVPRLVAVPGASLQAVDGLAELRTSYNIVALQQDRRALPGPIRALLDAVLGGVSAYFAACAASGARGAPPGALLADIDRALLAALGAPEGQIRRTTLDALVGLRRALFPHAPRPVDPDAGRLAPGGPQLLPVAAE